MIDGLQYDCCFSQQIQKETPFFVDYHNTIAFIWEFKYFGWKNVTFVFEKLHRAVIMQKDNKMLCCYYHPRLQYSQVHDLLATWKQKKFACLFFILQQFLFTQKIIIQYFSFDNFIFSKHNFLMCIIPFFLEFEIHFISREYKLKISPFLYNRLELSKHFFDLFHDKLDLF